MTTKGAQLVCAALALTALTGCDRVQRAAEFTDSAAAVQERSHLQLISRETAETVASMGYPKQLQAFSEAGKSINKDPVMVEWSHKIAGALIAQAVQMYPHTQGWDWKLAVVSTEELNAWCMAGGKMALYTGLVEATDGNAHKIAAVLGHEIAHALLEHSRRGLSREALLSSSLWIAGKSFKVGELRMAAISSDINLGLKSMARQEEREADVLGLELMARAGFDPAEGAQVWRDFQRQQQGTGIKRLEGFLGTHPLDEERLATLTALAQKLERSLPKAAAKNEVTP